MPLSRRRSSAWSSRVRSSLLALALALSAAAVASAQVADLVDRSAFRVCADPANKPLSAEDGSGFENRIAELLAGELGVPVQYTWFPQVTGFVRNTLQAGRCDVVMGYAQGDELVLNTNHYYTSTHVLVVKADGDLADVDTLADPRLKGKRIGVVAGAPPTTHVARLGLMPDAVPYKLMIDRRVEDPAGQMLADLKAGKTDAALLWGPIGGPLVKQRHPGLKAIPLLEEQGTPRLVYRITMGVRAGEDEWKRQLNSLIRRNQDQIDAILRDAGVPILDDFGKGEKPAG
ncbi:MAG: substrate-binding domain-containing protein [Amaricoccus sp.]|nr:substrate-binding domain-containing protein [Amaricoccus sp.]